jgi:transcriptional regulator with XRE-family HTH domain
MARVRRAEARIVGARLAKNLVSDAGAEVRKSRKRRGLTQTALARRIGISQARLAEIEAGQGGGAPLEVWFAIAQALGRYLKFEFARDPQMELADAGHLAVQELVIRVAKAAGWEVQFEAPSPGWASRRSIDVRLVDRKERRIVIVECWNTFGDLGAAARSSNDKVREAEQQAVAIAGGGSPFVVGLLWVVRDTRANRELAGRYAGAFESRFPGSSHAWVEALVKRERMPTSPGMVWCDVDAKRVFARRKPTARN